MSVRRAEKLNENITNQCKVADAGVITNYRVRIAIVLRVRWVANCPKLHWLSSNADRLVALSVQLAGAG